jgi:hypothetical protein
MHCSLACLTCVGGSLGMTAFLLCQMTKMLDLLEDYMHYRKHRYFRLDGASAIEDRRDMVRATHATPCHAPTSPSPGSCLHLTRALR